MDVTIPGICCRNLCVMLGTLILLFSAVDTQGGNYAGDAYGMSAKNTSDTAQYPEHNFLPPNPGQYSLLPRVGRSVPDINSNNFSMAFRCFVTNTSLFEWASVFFPNVRYTFADTPPDRILRASGKVECLLSRLWQNDSVQHFESLCIIQSSLVKQAISDRGGQPVSVNCQVSQDATTFIQIAQPGPEGAFEAVVKRSVSSSASGGGASVHLEYLGQPPRDESGCLAEYSDPTVVFDDIYSLNPAGRFAARLADHVVTLDINGGHDEVRSFLSIPVAGQPPAIIIAGHSANAARSAMAEKTLDDFVISRLYPHGQVDNRFGHRGMLFNDLARDDDRILASAAPGDGTFLVAGSGTNAVARGEAGTHKDMVILAYTNDGQPVTGFGSLGKIVRDFAGGDDEIRALGVFTNNNGARQIVAAGYVTSNHPENSSQDSALLIFTENGDLVCQKINDFAGGDDQFHSLDIIGQGENTRIIAVGHVTSVHGDTIRRNGYIQVFMPDCSPDNDFASNGLWNADGEGNNERLWAVDVIEHEGEQHIITASISDRAEYAVVPIHRLTLSRFDPQGNLDTHFGDGGHTQIAVTSPEHQPVTLYSLQQEGSTPLILVGKYASASCQCDNNVLTAFRWNGMHDERFDTPFNQFGGGNGAVRAIGSLSFANGEKRIIVAGYGFGPEGSAQQSDAAERDFILAGYHLSGQPDTCFGMTTEQLRDTVDCQLYLSQRDDSTVSPSMSIPDLPAMPSHSVSSPSTPASTSDIPMETSPSHPSSGNENQGAIAGVSTLAAISIAGNIAFGVSLLVYMVKKRSNTK